MKIGEIWLVNLDPTIGSEIQKTRPVVILNPGHPKNLNLAIVVPITGYKQFKDNNPFFISLDANQYTGLKKKSNVDCFQIRAIPHSRFIKKYGSVSDEGFDEIKQSISLILDIEEFHCE